MERSRIQELLESIDEMKAHLAGKQDVAPGNIHFASEPDPREIRKCMGLSQEDFAYLLGISARTLQNWEQGRRQPTGPAMRLLQIAAVHPEVLLELG
jgi:putative transcriptional regulator